MQQRVLQAAADWVWVPPLATEVVTSDYRLVVYPAHFLHPTAVVSSQTDRPVAEVFEEISSYTRDLGRSTLHWWINGQTRPGSTEEDLQALGATRAETVDVMGLDLTGDLPDLDVPADITLARVLDLPTARAFDEVNHAVWGSPKETDEQLAGRVADAQRELADGTGVRIVAHLDDLPAAIGGLAMAGDVGRLWGAASLESVRGRGSYRAVLAYRLQQARELGATLALVKGRVQTSGPILTRAGFSTFGQERCWRFDL